MVEVRNIEKLREEAEQADDLQLFWHNMLEKLPTELLAQAIINDVRGAREYLSLSSKNDKKSSTKSGQEEGEEVEEDDDDEEDDEEGVEEEEEEEAEEEKNREEDKNKEKKKKKAPRKRFHFTKNKVRPPNFESIPIMPLTEEFLARETVGTWVQHVANVLDSYEVTEAEACLILTRRIQIPPIKNQLEAMLATATMRQCVEEVLRLGERWSPCQHIFFEKPEEQSYQAYVHEIQRRAELSGTQLGHKILVDQVLAQVQDVVLKQRLLDYEDDLEEMVRVADETSSRLAQIAKHAKQGATASETRIEAVQTYKKSKGATEGQDTSDTDEEEEDLTAMMRFGRQSRNRQVQNLKQGRRDSRCCYYCGEPGHIAKWCPKRLADERRQQGKRKKGWPSKRQFVVCTQMGASLQYLTICVNGVETQALIDSGTQTSVISHEFFQRLPHGKSQLRETKLRVVSANGAPMRVQGACEVEIELGPHKIKENCVVVHDLNMKFIMGLTAQTKFKLTICPAECRVSIGDDNFSTGTRKAAGSTGINAIRDAEDLTRNQQRQLEKLLDRNADVLVQELEMRAPVKGVQHEIELETGTRPISLPVRRFSPREIEQLQKHVHELHEKHVIRESNSPWCARALLVPKKDGTTCMVIDYTALNNKTIKDKHPLPNISAMFQRLEGATYFSLLDLASGYYQFSMRRADIEKTAFATPEGLYEFTRMPMGLSNAPATFQRAMNHIFAGMINQGVMVFIDDILVYSKTWNEHMELLREVFRCMRENNLQAKLSKCSFAKKETKYLGFVISKDTKRPDPAKVKAIQEMRPPKDKSEVRSVLGLAGFYRDFIKNFSGIVKPLNDLLTKDVEFVWAKDQQEAFDKLKNAISERSMLEFPRKSWPFEVHTDASTTAIGAVLLQRDPQGQPHIIEHFSKALARAQQRLSIPVLECYAIIMALRKFRPFIFGTHFSIFTDHYGLQFLKSKKSPSAQMQRWWWEVSEYDFDITYRKGEINIADPLSRLVSREELQRAEEDLVNVVDLRICAGELSDRFEVERIIDRKTEGRRIMYCVKWKGYAMRDATWEPRTNLMQDCPSLVREFDEKWKREQQKKEEQLQRALKQTLDRQKL